MLLVVAWSVTNKPLQVPLITISFQWLRILMFIIHTVILTVIQLTVVPCNLCQIFKTPYPNIKRKPTSTAEIEKVIKSLKSKIHMNMMKCTLKLLKISSPFIRWYLNYTFNKSLSTVIFTDQLKFSLIKPIYNKAIKTLYLAIQLYHF